MIPAEAVEAAAKAMALKSYNREFDAMDDYTQNFLRDNARLALEAAAPHIRAQTLEEAADAWDMRSGEFEDTTPGYLKYLAVKERGTRGDD